MYKRTYVYRCPIVLNGGNYIDKIYKMNGSCRDNRHNGGYCRILMFYGVSY